MEAVRVAAVRPKSPVVSSTRKVMVNGPPMIATASAPMPTSGAGQRIDADVDADGRPAPR